MVLCVYLKVGNFQPVLTPSGSLACHHEGLVVGVRVPVGGVGGEHAVEGAQQFVCGGDGGAIEVSVAVAV